MKIQNKIIELRESIQMVAKISGISTDKASFDMLKPHEEFEANLKKIGLIYTHEIDTMLNFFREQYKQRPQKYVGDKEFYDMLWRCLMKGMTMNDALYRCEYIIKREMILVDSHYAIAKPYYENFD